MRLKCTIILAAVLLIFALPNISQPYVNVEDLRSVYEFEFGKENRIVADNGALLKCSLQSKKSAIRPAANGAVTVSVSANWTCR